MLRAALLKDQVRTSSFPCFCEWFAKVAFKSGVSADNIKLMWSISILADCVHLQTDVDNLAKWCDMWQLNFNATKYTVIHFGWATHSYEDYYLNGVLLDSVDSYKDLGILFDTSQSCTNMFQK